MYYIQYFCHDYTIYIFITLIDFITIIEVFIAYQYLAIVSISVFNFEKLYVLCTFFNFQKLRNFLSYVNVFYWLIMNNQCYLLVQVEVLSFYLIVLLVYRQHYHTVATYLHLFQSHNCPHRWLILVFLYVSDNFTARKCNVITSFPLSCFIFK